MRASAYTSTPAPSDSLARARAAMLAEAAKRSSRRSSWLKSVLFVAAAVFGTVLATLLAGAAGGAVSTRVLLSHLAAMLPVILAGAVACVAAFIPRRRGVRLATLGVGLIAAALLVVLRQGTPSASPGWVCTVSHVGVAVVPGVVALLRLRDQAFSVVRSLAAGLAVGATGALVGELVCEQGALHVALWHLPAWAISTAVVLLVSSRLTPRSFAP